MSTKKKAKSKKKLNDDNSKKNEINENLCSTNKSKVKIILISVKDIKDKVKQLFNKKVINIKSLYAKTINCLLIANNNVKDNVLARKVFAKYAISIISTLIIVGVMLNINKIPTNNEISKRSIKSGNELWNIADNNDMSVEKLIELNPNIYEKLYDGQILNLNEINSNTEIKTVEYAEVNEQIPFETKFQGDEKLQKGERKVLEVGKAGQKILNVQLIKENGIEVDRIVYNEKIIEEPKAQVVAIGINQTIAKNNSSLFMLPALGSISSRFGSRWGRIHEGIDISGKVGDPVYAAADGTVIFSGSESGYGNLIKIDHGNGYITYYGHNSKNLVSVGQKVTKGTKISQIGNTGRSTGPHVHFEVRKNDVPINPSKFLNN